jgi:hypothetical protein
MDTDPVSETSCLCSQEHRTMDKFQNPSNSICYTPSSEPFKIYFQHYLRTKQTEVRHILTTRWIRSENLWRWYIGTNIMFFWTLSIVPFLSKNTPSCFFVKTQLFGDWILSPSSGKTYTVNPINRASPYLRAAQHRELNWGAFWILFSLNMNFRYYYFYISRAC